MNYKEDRPWGTFENLLDVDYCKVKEIVIKKGYAGVYSCPALKLPMIIDSFCT